MTTSKRQSYNKTRRVGSEPNLGQKAAEREKKSKAQLSHMEGRRPSSARGRFVAWCKQEQGLELKGQRHMQSEDEGPLYLQAHNNNFKGEKLL